MRRGDGPILFALCGVAIVTVAVRPPGAGESTDDESREATVVAAGSGPLTHASPEAAAACAHAAQVPRAAAASTPIVASRPTVPPVEALAPLVEMFGTPIVGTPTKSPAALPRDRDLGGAFRADGRVILVALSASWCGPCARELPALLALGAALEAGLNARVVLVMNDDVGGPLGLEAAVEQLWENAEPTSRARPAWLEVRADPDAHWAHWAGDRAAPLPRTLLLDGEGTLRARIDGPLQAAHAERLLLLAEALASRGAL
jgi:thiol-disulfide isomerase/thioredoxin